MAFEYAPFVNPYGASIGDTIARSGDAQAHAAEMIAQAQARAAEIKGQAWAGAVQNIAQIPAQIQQQKNQQLDQSLKRQQLQEGIDSKQEADRRRVIITAGRVIGSAKDANDAVSGITDLVGLGGFPKEVGAHIISQIQAGGPDGFSALQNKYTGFASQYEEAVKLGKDESLVKPSTGAVVARGTPSTTVLRPGDVAVQPNAPGAPATPIASAPFAPGTGQHVVNGQVVDAMGAPVGAAIPPQEKPSEVAVNQARVTELKGQAAKIDAELNGTMPVSATDKLRLDLERQKIGNELEHYRMTEAHDDPSTPKNQERLEQQYRGVLTKVLSSRSGGMGLEDTKVNQAKHLIALFDQTKDPKTGDYNIPRVLQTEIAMGLARLVSPTGVVSEGTLNEINQRTAKGDVAGTLTYLTGHPFSGSTQDIFKMYRDSIERQGKVAQDNRESYLNTMRAYAPTDLADERRQALEKGLGLNRLDAAGSTLQPNATHIVEQGGVRYQVTTDASGKVIKSEPVRQ